LQNVSNYLPIYAVDRVLQNVSNYLPIYAVMLCKAPEE